MSDGKHGFTAHVRVGMAGALDPRLLVLSTTVVLVTTAVTAVPAWRVFAGALDPSPRASAFARGFDGLVFQDVVMAFVRSAAPVSGAAMLSALLAVLSWPFLAGMGVSAGQGNRRRSFAAWLEAGIAYYTRMLRVALVAIVPLAFSAGVAALAFWWARRHAQTALLETDAAFGWRIAVSAAVVFFACVQATLDAGRAAFGADDALASGWQAWLRGVRLSLRYPLAVFGSYFAATLASYAVAFPLLVARLRVSGPSVVQLVLGFVLAQLAVAALGWGRAARLAALTALSRSLSATTGSTPADAPLAVPSSHHRAPPSIVSRPGSA